MPNFVLYWCVCRRGKIFAMGKSEFAAEALGVLMCLMLVFFDVFDSFCRFTKFVKLQIVPFKKRIFAF